MPSESQASLIVRESNGRPFYEAKFRHDGQQIKRRIGPAWLDRDSSGGWQRRRGRVPEDAFDERRAHAAAAGMVKAYVSHAADAERVDRERRNHGITFRELAAAYVAWLRDVKGAKPATLRDHGYVLAEPGTPYKRGHGELLGHVMRALGDRPARAISTREIDGLLRTVADTGVSARAVNKIRNIIAAAFNYGMRESAFGLPRNPALAADLRREAHQGVLHTTHPQRSSRSPRRSPPDCAAIRRSNETPPRSHSMSKTPSSFASRHTRVFDSGSSSPFAGATSTSRARSSRSPER